MRYTRLLVMLSALVLVIACSGGGADPPSSTRPVPSPDTSIVAIGDSITQGDTFRDSFRRPLWLALQADGYDVDFVGSQASNFEGDPPHRDFDWDHEGHWGRRADEVLAGLPGWLQGYEPDIALVHLGTNDLLGDEPYEQIIGELRGIAQAVRDDNPRAVVLLARIIPGTLADYNQRVDTYNGFISELAADMSSAESPVVAIDLRSGFDAASMTHDGVHPNADGEAFMAQRWYEALLPWLAR